MQADECATLTTVELVRVALVVVRPPWSLADNYPLAGVTAVFLPRWSFLGLEAQALLPSVSTAVLVIVKK